MTETPMQCVFCDSLLADDPEKEAHLMGCPDSPFWNRFRRLRKVLRVDFERGSNGLSFDECTAPRIARLREFGLAFTFSRMLAYQLGKDTWSAFVRAA